MTNSRLLGSWVDLRRNLLRVWNSRQVERLAVSLGLVVTAVVVRSEQQITFINDFEIVFLLVTTFSNSLLTHSTTARHIALGKTSRWQEGHWLLQRSYTRLDFRRLGALRNDFILSLSAGVRLSFQPVPVLVPDLLVAT